MVLSEGPALSIGSFQKVQREVIYFPYVVKKMKSRHKLSKHCSVYSKTRLWLYNFWTPTKSNIPDV